MNYHFFSHFTFHNIISNYRIHKRGSTYRRYRKIVLTAKKKVGGIFTNILRHTWYFWRVHISNEVQKRNLKKESYGSGHHLIVAAG